MTKRIKTKNSTGFYASREYREDGTRLKKPQVMNKQSGNGGERRGRKSSHKGKDKNRMTVSEDDTIKQESKVFHSGFIMLRNAQEHLQAVGINLKNKS